MRKQCLPLINFGEELTGVRNEKLRSGIMNGNLEELTSDWLGESVYENPEKDKLMSDFLYSLDFHKEVVGETTIWWAKFNDIYVYFKLNGDLMFYAEYESGIKYLKDKGFTFEVKEESTEEKPEIINQAAKHFVEVYSEEIENNEVTSDMIYEWWGMTCDQYGYSQENKSDVIDEIEDAVFDILGKRTYDVQFDDDTDSNRQGINGTYQQCMNWIKFNRTDKSTYFGDYAGGTVSIFCLETGETVYSDNI